jgi:hypothetical protein
MTERPEEGSATESASVRQSAGHQPPQSAWSRWPARTRVLWTLCAISYGIFLANFYWFARASTFTEWAGLGTVHGPNKIIVSFRNDDLSVYSNPSLEDSVLSLFKAHGVRQTFAFIPDPAGYVGGDIDQPPGNSAIVDSLRNWEREGSIEFALHGFTHLKNGVGAGEFDGLPADAQYRMIRRGKAMLDSTLGTNVRMFAPPWNQADEKTVQACAMAGIDRFSGYVGIPPASGMVAVNTNCQLFDHPGDIPTVDRALELAGTGSGTRFVNILYHSRVDFPDAGAFRRVDSLLTFLRSDPRIEILSLGEVVERYHGLLLPCSESGWNIVEGEYAMYFAKPYLSAFSRLPILSGKINDLEWRHQRALESYHCGDYRAASLQSAVVVKQSGNWLALGRMVAPLAALGIIGVLLLSHASRRAVISVYAVLLVTIVIALLIFVFGSHLSPVRTAEVGRLALVFAGGLLLVLPWLRQFDARHNLHL